MFRRNYTPLILSALALILSSVSMTVNILNRKQKQHSVIVHDAGVSDAGGDR